MALVRDSLQEAIAAAHAAYQLKIAAADAELKIAMLKPETVAGGIIVYGEAFNRASVEFQNDLGAAQAKFVAEITASITTAQASLASSLPQSPEEMIRMQQAMAAQMAETQTQMLKAMVPAPPATKYQG